MKAQIRELVRKFNNFPMTKKARITADLVWIFGLLLFLSSILNVHKLYVTVAGVVIFFIGLTIGFTALVVERIQRK